jgi:hypothetical protein
MIRAKTVIKDKFWILRDDNVKIGEAEAVSQGYRIRIGDRYYHSKSLPAIDGSDAVKLDIAVDNSHTVYGYDVGCRAYNAIWDAQKRIPLFNKSSNSRSWFAAGWYAIKQHRTWRISRNPKSILLDRYEFKGPFHSREEANDQSL